MADVVTTQVLESGPKWHKVRLLNQSDGTGESAVTKVDVSTLSGLNGQTVVGVSLVEAAWDITGGYVQLLFDATTDDELANLSGQGNVYYDGGIHDPQSTGYTGDIKLTTSGFASGDSYDLTLLFRKRYA